MLLNTVFFQAAAWQWEHTLSVGCPHSFQTSRAAPKLQKAFRCDYREGPICKVPPSTHRAATAAPSSQVASQQRVRLELPWQEAAKCLWLPIKWMLFIKNVFSVTCFFTSQSEHSWDFSRSAVHRDVPLLYCNPLKWGFLLLPLGSEESRPPQAPGGSHSPITAIRYGWDLDFSIFVWKSSSWCHFTPYKSPQYQAHKPKWS